MRRILFVLIFCAATAMPTAALAASSGNSAGPAPYSRLAAQWWQWVLQTPTPQNPIFDPDGRNCQVNQPDNVFFLAGTSLSEPVTRTCQVPSSTPIFFPVVNQFYGTFLDDNQTLYPTAKSIPEQRAVVACMADPHTPMAWLDGVPLTIVHERSVPFVVHLPTDNIFGVDEEDTPNLMVAPTVDEGDYVLLPSLDPGSHTIRFTNDPGASCSIAIDVTYHLTVT